MCPVVRWDAYKIRRFMKWLDNQGGIGKDKAYKNELVNICCNCSFLCWWLIRYFEYNVCFSYSICLTVLVTYE